MLSNGYCITCDDNAPLRPSSIRDYQRFWLAFDFDFEPASLQQFLIAKSNSILVCFGLQGFGGKGGCDVYQRTSQVDRPYDGRVFEGLKGS
jgi:hypothetical protein